MMAVRGSVVVAGLSQLGNPSSFSASQKSGPSSVASIGLGGDTERLGAAPDLVTTLDGVFTVSGALRFVILALTLNGSIILFWSLMGLLPPRTPAASSRDLSPVAELQPPQLHGDNYNYGDNYANFVDTEYSQLAY